MKKETLKEKLIKRKESKILKEIEFPLKKDGSINWKSPEKSTCQECQWEDNEHSFSCSYYKPKKCPFPKEKSKSECGCFCHKEKPISENYDGLVHGNMCCDKMNGSLILFGVHTLLQAEREKIIGERKCGKCGFDFIKMWKICPECGAILKRSHKIKIIKKKYGIII